MSPLLAYLAVVGVLLALGMIAICLPLTPTRPCHRCESRVTITARRCRQCGYVF